MKVSRGSCIHWSFWRREGVEKSAIQNLGFFSWKSQFEAPKIQAKCWKTSTFQENKTNSQFYAFVRSCARIRSWFCCGRSCSSRPLRKEVKETGHKLWWFHICGEGEVQPFPHLFSLSFFWRKEVIIDYISSPYSYPLKVGKQGFPFPLPGLGELPFQCKHGNFTEARLRLLRVASYPLLVAFHQKWGFTYKGFWSPHPLFSIRPLLFFPPLLFLFGFCVNRAVFILPKN